MKEKRPLLTVSDLNVVYTSANAVVHALNGVSFSIGRQETLGLVGETGAGKTTTALSILGLLPEHTGQIRGGKIVFDDLSLLELSDVEMQAIRGKRISMIFQDPMTSLNPVMTIGEQIEEALYLHHSGLTADKLKARVNEIIELVGIGSERRHEYPHQFSGGMKQRVVIAIALACSPELLIADEPTTALDVTIQAQVLNMMEELKQRLEMSMIMITHDLGIVAKTCDTVAVLYAGEIVEFGTFNDFFVNKLHHPYTNGLFGSIPDIYSEEERLHPIEGILPDPTDLPGGCKFHPRCPRVRDICRRQNPESLRSGSHAVKCHLFKEVKGYE
jgi:peptide/nickel transport system ATP-binding protein